MTQQPAIQWGALEFVHPETQPPAEGYQIHAMAEGTHFDNPKALLEVVKSLLNDGSLAVLQGWDNREAPIRLRLSAPTATAGPALAAAEAALMNQVMAEAKAPLRQTPSATDAATNVFDVVAATLDRDTSEGWDIEEERREYRYYLLTLTCLPFVRTEESTLVAALPTNGSTTVDIDDGTSAAAWQVVEVSGIFNYGITSTSGYVELAGIGDYYGRWTPVRPYLQFSRTSGVAMGATPYLRITLSTWRLDTLGPRLLTNNGMLDPIAIGTGAVVPGVADYYFKPTTASVPLNIVVGGEIGEKRLPVNLRVHHVARTDILPIGGTRRQLPRAAAVSGSAPTTASIRLYDAGPAALGSDILVHSSRNTLWQPALRPFRVSSATETADGSTISGKRNTLGSAMTFRVPARLLTEGTYALMANMNVTTAGSLGWSARMVSSAGAATVGSSVVLSGSTPLPVTTGYQVVRLASLPLPVVLAEADQMVELTLTGTANMTIDEAWLFGLHDGVLTWVRDTDSLSWIDIRSPELGAARPSVFGGTGAFGANGMCIDWKCQAFGTHRFMPGVMQIFTVTTSSLVSQSEIEFYPRGHSHVQASWVA